MKILIAGDFCAKGRVGQELRNRNFDGLLGQVKPILEKVDYSFVNLECPIVEHDAQPIPKCGPNLKGPREMVDALQWAGFDCFTLANNHILDYGETGMLDTLMYLNDMRADYVGGGNSLRQASETLYKSIDGRTLAVINCCEHEFSIATENSSGANPLNPIQQYYKIQEARKNANYVLVIVHGGHEHYQLPSPRMKETYRFFVDAGADAVINHHQHCYSGYEVYKGKPIFYGIGNFLFDWDGERNSIWNEGYMVELNFDDNISWKLIPYVQCAEKPIVELMVGDKMKEFYSQVKKLSTIITDDEKLVATYSNLINLKSPGQKIVFTPYTNRYLRVLAYRGWIPSFLNNKKISEIINYIACESHRDISLSILQRLLK